MFLDEKELIVLTGRKMKSKQIAALRDMGVPFRVNATGHPVVTRSSIEGRKQEQEPRPKWIPRVLKESQGL
ncbi:DUF4224 domain-containing protein [Herbaspirillum seropedicae]|uniref:DUF4224 domain-containing protein n=1 Tax=Herbaspirillum seropedicae TaxID=964 RepID=UPI0011228290|nr:DUF4224 domain-containing protein [Herbaspirillum seropedicae]QDD65530.1 DUF4224 domain-containing protein [Herbaspirillum seropedicae]